MEILLRVSNIVLAKSTVTIVEANNTKVTQCQTRIASECLTRNKEEVFIAELRSLLPKLISNYINTIQSNSTLELIISQKIASIPLVSVESFIRIGLKKQFRIFQFAGIVTGLFIGLFQVIISFIFLS